MIRSLDHIQLAMPAGQEEKARQFFVDLLGFIEIEKPKPLRSRGGVWFQAGAAQLHLGVQPAFKPATKAHPAFLVDNLEKLRTKLMAHQIQIKLDSGTPNAPRFFVNDPFGNRIEFIQDGFGFNRHYWK